MIVGDNPGAHVPSESPEATPELLQLAQDLFVVSAPLRFLGVELGCRMTVLRVEGQLLLHSPIALQPAELEGLGEPRWVLAPNKFHHMFAGAWLERGLEGFAAPGLEKKRPELKFEHQVTEPVEVGGGAVRLIPLRSLPLVNEVALLHKPSRTLVLTDLVFNLSPRAPWLTRAAMRAAWATPGCRCSLLERVFMNRAAARDDLRGLLELDFDRLVMSHGEVLETGGREALRGAYRWLGEL